MAQLKVKRTEKQKQAWEALDMPSIDALMYGGAKGGGKSYFMCAWLFTVVWAIAVAANLKPSKNPPHVAFMGRKQATDLTGTTLQTWREIIPEEYYELKAATEKDPKHILIAGRIAIDYGGLDRQEQINKFNSAEYIIMCIDQAEEVTKDEIAVLRGSLRMVLKDEDGHPIVPTGRDGKPLLNSNTGEPLKHWPYKELYTANPRNCWLKDDFIVNQQPGHMFVPALPSDNPHLPDDYVEKTLVRAFGHRPELLRAYRDGDWSAIEGAEQIIKSEWLNEAASRECYAPQKKRYIVCDPARFGDDETVIFVMDNAEILGKKILGYCRTTEISSRLAILSRQNGDCQVVVESTGGDVGAGVVDELVQMGVEVVVFNPAGECTVTNADGKKLYGNMRCEAWSKAAQMLAKGVLEEESNTLLCCNNMYTDLKTQLTFPNYKYSGPRLMVEKKSELKSSKRMGRSPDHADTYIIALWAWDKIDYMYENPELGYKERPRTRKTKSAMSM